MPLAPKGARRSVWLALSRYGRIKLGQDDDEPEFSTVSWLTMLFAAGMGVGLLYWGTAEPLTHYLLIAEYEDPRASAGLALFITNFHWGLHAWSIYALTGLVIAYFGFRRGCPSLVSAPIIEVFGSNALTRPIGRPPNHVQVFHASFSYQAATWSKPRRVVAKVEWHPGELYPKVGFIVTNLSRPAERVTKFYNGRGTAEQWIKEGKHAIN